MTQEQFEREGRYRVAMTVAKAMLAEGLIAKEEYRVIDTIFIEKYRPLFGSLYAPETVDTSGLQR